MAIETTTPPVEKTRTTQSNGTGTIGARTAAQTTESVVVTKTKRLGGSKKRKSRTILMVLAVLLLAVAAWYLLFNKETKQQTVVRFAAIERGDVTKTVSATGTLQATRTVQVGSQVSGTIKALHADFNDHVTKGQLLAELDPTSYEAAVNEAKANLTKAEADYNNAQRDESRARDLLAKELIAQAEYDVTKTKLLNTQASVQQVKAQLERAQVNLGYTIIRSPISGVITSRAVDVGQTVAASLNAPTLFIIAEDLHTMQVSANVDEADIGQVQQGQEVKFTVDAFPGEHFDGTVGQIRLNPTTVQNVVTYAVIINANNPTGKLLPGMTATINIVTSSLQDVLKIPAAALRFNPSPEIAAELRIPVDSMGNGRRGGPSRDSQSTNQTAGSQQGSAMRQGNEQSRGQAGGAQRGNQQGAQQGIPGGAGASGAMVSGQGGFQARPRTIYIKSKESNPNGTPKLIPIKVIPGLSDGTFTAIQGAPDLKSGDSVIVSAISTSATEASAGTQQPGTSPFGNMRGGGRRR